MGKAHQAPPSSKKRYRYVAHHALERLRERIISLDIGHRLDGDLKVWLDQAVEHSIREGNVEAIVDRNEAGRLVNFGEQLGAPAFAVVKGNDRKSSQYTEAIVTIMDDVMVAQYQERNVWKTGSVMAQQLAKLPAGTIVKREPKEPTPVVELRRPQPDLPPPVVAAATKQMLLSYVGATGVTYEVVEKENIKARLLELANDADVDVETVRAWSEIPLSLRVQIDIDI